ncbi:ATP-dependent nuclease [Tumebacillus flagellatus]|uniref:AAA+ ATPase domain-containing protein n=1 Tax=Tumebacillus flagellatus TaxID=1157490 RepID=A0A074LKL5_9BACL|nr:ATP-binding protein [Tumebacillus flagellatus]KEO81629.1 hypothetical protein EL26_19835 [Tumebacillus flagellatus]
MAEKLANDEKKTFIKSINFENYRGFKNKHVLSLADFGQVTFLSGANNSGKSLIARLFSIFQGHEQFPRGDLSKVSLRMDNFSDKDYHEFDSSEAIKISFEIDCSALGYLSNDFLRSWINRMNGKIFYNFTIMNNLGNIFCYMSVGDGKTETHYFNKVSHKVVYNEDFSMDFDERDAYEFYNTLYHEIRERVLVFDSIRSFDRESNRSFSISGGELLKWLRTRKNHGDIRKAKEQVSHWLLELGLEVPRAVRVDDEDDLLLFTFENHLELSSEEIGTGYTMLYILLMEIARSKKQLILIDEIESHLQPGLIRALLKIIRNQTGVQFVLATHSPAVMEAATAGDYIYRFQKENGQCTFEGFFRSKKGNSREAKMMRSVFDDLGVIPGDALLSNAVIWVEGPSEKLWVRAWLKTYFEVYRKKHKIKGSLLEGLHYSILMTGGSLIKNYSFSEKEISHEDYKVDDQLHVLRVNPNPFVMIDSDNAEAGSKKRLRNLRIAQELNDQNGQSQLFTNKVWEEGELEFHLEEIPNFWLLKGRELENYAHPQLVKEFYKRLCEKSPKVKNVTTLSDSDWDVYSASDGAGSILSERGLTGVDAPSGTLKHKNELAQFVYQNLEADHFTLDGKTPAPNPEMITDLTYQLEKMIRYILRVNNMLPDPPATPTE